MNQLISPDTRCTYYIPVHTCTQLKSIEYNYLLSTAAINPKKMNYALITRDPAPSMLLRSGFNSANPRNGDSKSIHSSITLPIIVVLNIPNTFNSNMPTQVRGSRHPSRIRLARSRRLNRKSHLPHRGSQPKGRAAHRISGGLDPWISSMDLVSLVHPV